MNDQRPTRCPCSADSRRKAGPAPLSFRKAETGVSQSSMNVWVTGMRLCSRASARASSTPGVTAGVSAATVKERPLGVGEPQPARVQQHRQVVEHVSRLLGDALVALVACGARHLLGLLADLVADVRRIGEQRGGVGALGPLGGAGGDRALEAGQRLVRQRRLELAVVEAAALARVAGGAGG